MPLAVFGGSREIMNQIAPAGPIYQAGTLSGNPIAVTSGLATLSILQRDPSVFKQVEDTTIASDGSSHPRRSDAHISAYYPYL